MNLPVETHKCLIHVLTACSLTANGALLVACLRAPRAVSSEIGGYRQLLLLFVAVDVALSLVYSVAVPGIQMNARGFILFAHNLMHVDERIAVAVLLGAGALLFASFALLAAHFVYRYVALCRPSLLCTLEQRWRAVRFAALAIGCGCVLYGGLYAWLATAFVPTELTRQLFEAQLNETTNVSLTRDQPGFLAIVYWDDVGVFCWEQAPSHATLAAAVTLCAGVIGCCTACIVRRMRTLPAALNAASRKLQRQLLRGLLLQTLIPFAFSYVPIMVIYLWPLLRLDGGALGDTLILLTAIFPVVDPIIIILCITQYRQMTFAAIYALFSRSTGSGRKSPAAVGCARGSPPHEILSNASVSSSFMTSRSAMNTPTQIS